MSVCVISRSIDQGDFKTIQINNLINDNVLNFNKFAALTFERIQLVELLINSNLLTLDPGSTLKYSNRNR